MATRRKYKSASASSPAAGPGDAGGLSPPPASPANDDALVRAAQATHHAENLQRQHHARQQIGLPERELTPEQRQQVDAHIDGMGLSPHQARFLKSHPTLLTEPYIKLMAHAVMVARHAGVPEDTDAFDRAILAGVARDIEHHRALSQLTAASARPTEQNAQMHHEVGQAADDLQREAETHHAAFIAENPPPPPPAPRRTIPMSAPVSRVAPAISGHRQPPGWNTLTAAEREIAHNSFGDPNMSNEQKELLYLKNRQKYQKMKAEGSYSEQRG